MNLFKVEIKRAILSWQFFISLVITLIVVFSGVAIDILDFKTYKDIVELFTKGAGDSSSSIYLLITFIVVQIPFSTSYIIEKNNKYIMQLIFKTNLKNYTLVKFITNFVVGGLLLSSSLLIFLLLLSIFFPLVIDINFYISNGTFKGCFEDVFVYSPLLYLFIIIGLNFIFGGAYASLGLAISSLTNNKYVTIAGPFIFFIIYSIILEILGLQILLPQTCIIPSSVQGVSYITIFGQIAIITIISYITFAITIRRRGEIYV